MKIAVFLRSMALGDHVLLLPALRCIRDAYRDADLVFWTNYQPIAPFLRDHRLVDQVKVGGAPFVDPVKWIDIASDEDHWNLIGRPDMVFPYLLDLTGMDEKIAGLQRYCAVYPSTWLGGTRLHQVERFMDPLIRAGIPHQSYGDAKRIDRRCRDAHHPSDRVLVHPGAGHPAKIWPHYRALISDLQRDLYRVRVLCGPHDLQTVARLGLPADIIVRTSDLYELEKFLHSCSVFVGNDAGTGQLAAYLGVPTVSIFGPTDPSVWKHCGPRVQILRDCSHQNIDWIINPACEEAGCLEKVTIPDVLEGIDFVRCRDAA